MKKHWKQLGKTLGASVMFLLIFIGVPGLQPAYADGSVPSCDGADTSQGTGTCADIVRSGEAESHTSDKSFAAVGTKGKILTRYTVAAGIKLKASEKHNSSCKLVSKPSQIPAGATCIRGARGFHFTNSGISTSGAFIKWSDFVGSPGSSTPNAKWMRFVKRGSQWFKAGDQTGAGNCANKVWFNAPKPKLNWRQVINIRSFANWMFKGKVAVDAHSTATAFSKSWCHANGTSASATAESEGSSKAAASAFYKVRGLTQIKQWTNAKEAELTQSLKLTVNAEAEALAKTKASAEASTKVECNGAPPSQTTPPTFMQFREFNDLEVNWTSDHCVTVDFPEGHSGKVFWSATYGSFATSQKAAQDGVQVCSTYKAPGEVPAGGTDTITVTATDDTTGLSVTQSTQPFKIQPTAPPPM